jgi:1,4-alpha-glucan branching enzyme
LTGHDLYLFREGTHSRLYEKLGAHVEPDGTQFAVWAPNAAQVSVVGDFNGWDPRSHPMQPSDAGIWTARVRQARHGSLYKFHIVSRHGNFRADKSDPFAFRAEMAPKTGSMAWQLDYEWNDAEWMKTRARANALDAPW